MFLTQKIVCAITGALAACACSYYVAALWAARGFARERRREVKRGAFTPPVSILKPLRGVDPGMYESFRSHCQQQYPEYEIIFGVSDPADPAVAAVRQLQAEFPQREIRLVVCREGKGTNRKVSKLAQMLAHARHEYLIVNDSDIRVAREYLRSVMAPMADANAGLVTCLYRGVAAGTLGSRLEALGITVDFVPAVLVAQQFEGLKFGLGSTLALSRRGLEAAGGFESLADYLADDYELGARIARAGLTVQLAETVVEDHLPAYKFGEFLDHQLRWARTIRDSRPLGYAGFVVTFGLPWALLAVAASGGRAWSWALLAATAALRTAVAVAGAKLVQDRHSVRDLWLLPLRDVIALGVWFASFTGHRIAWRGEQYVLEKGKLRPA